MRQNPTEPDGAKMTSPSIDTSPSKPAEIKGKPFLLVVITAILRWIWYAIKGGDVTRENKAEKFWDMLAENFDQRPASEKDEQLYAGTIENLKRYLKKSDSVLEYGCATGTTVFEIVEYVQGVQGIDLSSKMIESAQRKAADLKMTKPVFFKATIFDERLKQGSYDVVVAFNILHLLEDIPKVMQRIEEVIKPGGLFISVTPCMGEKKTFLGGFVSFFSRTGIIPPMQSFTLCELEDSLAGSGFQVVETACMDPEVPQYFIVARKIER